jgi:hypothetical protein
MASAPKTRKPPILSNFAKANQRSARQLSVAAIKSAWERLRLMDETAGRQRPITLARRAERFW